MSPIAKLFSCNPKLIDDISAHVVNTPEGTTARGTAGRGLCKLTHDNDIISPKITIQSTHKNNYSILLHELVHAYTHPYIFAGDILRNNSHVDIADPVLKQAVQIHYDNMNEIYNDAVAKGYSSINGESIEECVLEFCANITHKKSTEQLKGMGLYDRLIGEIQRHIDSISTLNIPLVTKDGSSIIWKSSP